MQYNTAYNQYPEDGHGVYGEDQSALDTAFSSKSIRMAFIRKVYFIVSIQLLVTFGVALLFTYNDGAKMFAARNSWLLFVCFGVVMVTMLTMVCCENMRRQTPHNFILLAIFTVAEAFLIGFVTGSIPEHKKEIVVYAVLITVAVVLALTAFAFQTKIDFTVFNGIMFVALIVLLVMGILMIFIRSKILMLVYSGLGALIFSCYLVIDTQMMIGGNHKYTISPEEYIFASLTIYLDIINIFLYILQILNASRD